MTVIQIFNKKKVLIIRIHDYQTEYQMQKAIDDGWGRACYIKPEKLVFERERGESRHFYCNYF